MVQIPPLALEIFAHIVLVVVHHEFGDAVEVAPRRNSNVFVKFLWIHMGQ